MSFLDDVMKYESDAADIIKTAKGVVDGFQQTGTDPRPPSTIAAEQASNTKMWLWIGGGLLAAVVVYMVVKRK